MAERYEFAYSEYSVYGYALHLIRENAGQGECVLDLGCGHGAIAEECEALGYTYIGLDADVRAVKALVERGFEAHEVDLQGAADIRTVISDVLGGRRLACLVMLDTLEHLVHGPELLMGLAEQASVHPAVPLVLSVPNVTHFEVAAKLLQGRWDVTRVGLLDDTHVAFFSEQRLLDVLRDSGWRQIATNDFHVSATDQHFPDDDAALLKDTPVHQLLWRLRDRADPFATVNQFVRAFLPGPAVPAAAAIQVTDPPFLSVLTRTQGKRPDTLQETLLCLSAQECQEFECLILTHDVSPEALGNIQYFVDTLPVDVRHRFRVIPVTGGGRSRPLNVGLAHARGRYVSILDDDDIVFAHWVEEFRRLGDERPGRVLRAGVVAQEAEHGHWLNRVEYRNVGLFQSAYPPDFDLLAHLNDNYSPPCGLAFPLSAFRDLGISFDENLPVLEDWDVLLQAASLCGVVTTPEVTSVYRWWPKADSSLQRHSKLEWQSARGAVIRRVDETPLVLPAGSATTIRELLLESVELRNQIGSLQAQLESTRAEAQAQLESTRAEVQALHVENRDLRNDYDWIDRAAKAANRENQQRFDELTEEFKSSLSWRVTTPLRSLRRRGPVKS